LAAGAGYWLARPQPVYAIARTLRYSFTVTNTTPRLLKQTDFWVYAPVKQTSTQQTVRLTTSLPHTPITDPAGNQILHFVIPALPPNGSKIIAVAADLRLSDDPNPLPATDLERFLVPEPHIESDHPLIQARARALRTPDPLTTSRQIYQWVADHIEYAGYVREERGALHALQHRKGDCTEYADLFVALARASGIPARTVGGYIHGDNAVLKAQDYHNWAEFHHDGRWRVADPQKRAFMAKSSHYLALRIGTTGNPAPWGDAHQYAYSAEGIAVKM
jgi:transglutaminase-like putative cysteine protease